MLRTLAFLAATAMTGTSLAATSGFVARDVTVHGKSYHYQVFVPASLEGHPAVVLFLHGSGERGSDNRQQLTQGLPHWLEDHPDFPAVVVVPQVPDDQEWTDRQNVDMAMAALEQAVTEFHGDRHRLYLTGLSMGGYGAWQLAATHPNTFAAAAIVCGGVTPLSDERQLYVHGVPDGADAFAWTAKAIGKLPVWIFHGSDDTSVPTEQSRRMHAELAKRHDEVKYTEYPGVGHGSWINAYAEPDLWTWMFRHKR
ncbi:carboxylesterase family protein [Luteibacter sahnii]|uniref:carboxylesterase family protein n=1 Tax=Luteibacter sahnii TaxID=3021977 RepID=UPI002A6A9472|nr:prolyl oligopeptidase family serine peptidase [Luteibacter sp. PPL193]MDY1546737.1 prolyl oligopeptidase family serine peptidase [Luteibacter sp. PPL193]